MGYIYCIEDILDNKYVGSTKGEPFGRKKVHLYRKYKPSGQNYSSRKLHLEHSIIYILEECDNKILKEREQYWIENTECVNERRAIVNKKEYMDEWHMKNKEKQKQYRIDNREKINEYKRKWRKLKKQQSKLKSNE